MMSSSTSDPRPQIEQLSDQFINTQRMDILFVHCVSHDQVSAELAAHQGNGWSDWMGGAQKGGYHSGYPYSLTLFRLHRGEGDAGEIAP